MLILPTASFTKAWTWHLVHFQFVGDDIHWPSEFQATYDDSTRVYRFVFSGFAGD